MRVDEIGPSPSATSARPWTEKPASAPTVRRTSRLPPRSLPKTNRAPTQTSRAASRRPRSSFANSPAGINEKSRVNETSTSASIPQASIASSRCRRVWIIFGARSGWRTLSGCGSNVTTIDGTPASRARAATSRSIAWWPRWTPSKFPTVTTPPFGRSTDRNGSRRTCKAARILSDLGDNPSDEVVGVRLGDLHADDLADARRPAGRHVVDEHAAVDLGGLRGEPGLEKHLGLVARAFEEGVEGLAALRAVLRPRDPLLDLHQTVTARRFFFEWNRVPERLGARAGFGRVREDARVVEAHGLEKLFYF